MKIMSLKEFYKKEENSSKDISLYLNYLEKIKKELNERLDDVLLLKLSDAVVNDLCNQIRFIEGLENIINNSYQDLIFSSIENLTDGELKDIGQKYMNDLLKKREELQNQLEAKKHEKDLAEKTNREAFYRHGYDDKFYKATDTDIFFSENVDAHEYVKRIINSDMTREELDKMFSSVFLTREECFGLSEMIIKMRQIVKITNSLETLDEVADSFISLNGMGKIVGINSVQECQRMLEELQQKAKLKTDFFQNLPDNLKERIEAEGFDMNGEYGTLLKIYEDYKNNGKVTIPVGSYEKAYEKDVKELESKLDDTDKSISYLEEVIVDREELIKFIQSNFKTSENDLLTVENVIKKRNEYNALQAELGARADELEKKVSKLNENISAISKVLDKENESDFEILQARSSLRLMNLLGEPATEEGIHPYYEAETRRLKQYEIVIDTIKKLNSIKSQIDEILNSRNIIKNINGSNRQARIKLVEEYKDVCQKCYEQLKHEEVLRVVASFSFFEKESEILDAPRNFDELFKGGKAQYYKLTPQNFDEFKNRGCLPVNYTFDELEYIFKVSYYLGNQLFTSTKRGDGLYDFALSDKNLDATLYMQNVLATIYTNLYNSRKEEREYFIKEASKNLSKEMKDLIDMLDSGESFSSRESLVNYKLKLEAELKEKEEMLESLRTDLTKNKDNVDGVTTEDLEAYYTMLLGFYESMVSMEEIEKKVL